MSHYLLSVRGVEGEVRGAPRRLPRHRRAGPDALDAALGWAGKATAAINAPIDAPIDAPIEVRPFAAFGDRPMA